MGLAEFGGVVQNLDPSARIEAQHLVAPEALYRELAGGTPAAVRHVRNRAHAGDDRPVVARPLERRDSGGAARWWHRARFRGSRFMDLHAVKLVLLPRV